MRKVKLLGLAVLALFAFGTFAASGAYAVEAEEENKPQILVLEGKASELKGTFKAEKPTLVNLTGKKLIEAKEATALFEGCENLPTNVKDTNLCKDVPIHFFGVKEVEKKANCRSEDAKGNKDAVETVLALIDLHLSAELTAAKVLQPLLLAQVLGTALEAFVLFNCGLLKILVKGVVECLLLPGLVNIPAGNNIEILCRVNAGNDPELGTCNVLCDEFEKVTTLTAEYGEEKLDAWELIHFLGTLNKDIYIDD